MGALPGPRPISSHFIYFRVRLAYFWLLSLLLFPGWVGLHTFWALWQCLLLPQPPLDLQPEVKRLSFLVLEPWAVWSGLGLGCSLTSCLPNFYPPHVNVGLPILLAAVTSPLLCPRLYISAPPTCLDEYRFFKSLVVRLPCSSGCFSG